jgi:tetratricopeptide (TPR) repeat protein
VHAVELQPGHPSVVHHAVMAVDSTAVSRQEDASDPEPGFDGMFSRMSARPPGGFFVGWTPGRVPRPNPDGLSWPLEPGTDIVIQMHLRPHDAAIVRARVGFHFAESPADRTPVLIRLGSQTIDIPAGETGYTVTDSLPLPVDVELLGLYPHAHYLGKTMDVWAEAPDGAVRRILRIDDWDFNWQDAYAFASPVLLRAGTTIRLRYGYDNSAGNPRNPHAPPRRVVYGPHSTDEMAELWIQALPRLQSDLPVLQQELARKSVRDRVQGWEHLIRLNPRDAVAHASLGAFHASRGDAARAIEHYNAAIEAQPGFASAHYNLGIVLEARGDLDGAVRHYLDAIRINSDHAGAHNNLGNVLLAMGRTPEAAEHLRRAIELEPGQPEPYNNLGRLLWQQGQKERAIQQYRRAVEARPTASAARLNLAFALAALGRTSDALEEFGNTARLEPLAVEVQIAMAWILATHPDPAARRPEVATALAERAASLAGRPDARILDVRAAAEAAAGRFDRAASLAQEALRLATDSDPELAGRIRERVQLYLQRRPYTEPPR